jgi:hypothetical protein
MLPAMQMGTRTLSAFLGLAVVTGLQAQASLLINNPGFENPTAIDGNFQVVTPSALVGWSAYDPNSILDDTLDALGVIMPLGTDYFPAGAPEGRNAGLVFLSGNVGGGEAGFQQTLSSTLDLNTRYSLSVSVGNIASGTGLPPSASLGFFDLDGFPGYRVDLLAGGTVIASDNNTLAASIPEGEFRVSTVTLDIGASHLNSGQALGIRLVNLNTPGTEEVPGIEVDFDNVILTATPVPEPALAGCLAAGGVAGFALIRRRRRLRNRGAV